MSASHASLLLEADGGYSLRDERSKNRTTLNGDQIAGPERLYDGDVIGVGGTFLLFRSAKEVVGAFEEEGRTAGPFASLNPLMAQQFERARRVATSGRMVLLTGPTGSGRRTAARWIHELSGLKGSFVEILAREFIESLGAFREAQGGTLLITDIEELEGEALSALPRALANQELLALEQGKVAGESYNQTP